MTALERFALTQRTLKIQKLVSEHGAGLHPVKVDGCGYCNPPGPLGDYRGGGDPMTDLCAAPIDMVWKAPYRSLEDDRVTIGTRVCGHPKSSHWGNAFCMACDSNNDTAGMHHAFTPGPLGEYRA